MRRRLGKICLFSEELFPWQHDPANRPAVPTGRGLRQVHREIEAGVPGAGRDPASVTLVAVSKTFDAAAIEPVIAAGQRVFGENRVQEAKAKWPALMARDRPRACT